MRACVAFLALLTASTSVTIQKYETLEPISDIRVPLKSEYIECSLSDVIVISAPIVRDALYFLTRPDGHVTRLNITRPTYGYNAFHKQLTDNQLNDIEIKHESVFKTIVGVVNHKVFNLLPDSSGELKLFEDETRDMNSNDFLVGPLSEDDHGNWVLSLYYQDVRGKWVEMYQVITLEISEHIPSNPRSAMLSPGETFEFSFAYSIPDLQSCELRAPKSTFDRFYERDTHVDMDRCGYKITNVTFEDSGYWSITGVGKMVYYTQVYLNVKNDPLEVNKRNNTDRL